MLNLGLGKLLVILGVILVVVGCLIIVFGKVPFIGKLPGDINIQRENFSFYFPVTSSILLSIIISAIFWIFFRK